MTAFPTALSLEAANGFKLWTRRLGGAEHDVSLLRTNGRDWIVAFKPNPKIPTVFHLLDDGTWGHWLKTPAAEFKSAEAAFQALRRSEAPTP